MTPVFAHRRVRLLSSIILFCTGAWSVLAATSWPVVTEGLAPDPRWQWGRMSNGLRYVVRQNALPAGRVSYRLAVEVGGAHESPAEHGFAHFVEHMAFNGTRHFPGETLAGEMERRGIDFGPELSAFTFLSHTLYRIDAPGNTPADVDWVLSVLRDFADGLLFEPRQVKRERGVIASESRDRESVGKRFDRARRQTLYPLSPLSNPIEGDPAQATPERLREFYTKWYRPEHMIVVVVGDAEPAVLAAGVERQFASLRTPAGAPPTFDPGFRENPSVGTSNVVHDAQASGLLLEVISLTPFDHAEDAIERRRLLAAGLATQILQERLNEIARQDPKTFAPGMARIMAMTPFAYETSVSVQTASQEWARAARTLEHELRRSFEFTFFREEIAAARTRVLKGYEQAAKAAATAQSDDLAGWVMQEALWHAVSLSPDSALAFARSTLPQLDALEINRAWRSFWQERRARIFGYGFFPVVNGTGYISEAYEQATREKLDPPTPPPAATFAYTDFGHAGRLVQHRHDTAVDMHLLEFENGVRVNLKRTSFDANSVFLGARFGSGLQGEPPRSPGLGALTSLTLLNGGLGRHKPPELHHLLSIEPVGLQFSANEGSFLFSGSAATERIDLLLQLLCAYLTDAAWDPKAFEAATVQQLNRRDELSRTSEGVLSLNALYLATQLDQRYTVVPASSLGQLGLADLKAWLEPQLRAAPLEIGLVGDFPLDETIALLARTVGALPPRHPTATPSYPVRFSKQSAQHQLGVDYPCTRAALEVLWPADQGHDVHQSRRLEVLAALLNNRLFRRVREDLGVAYSPFAQYWKSETPAEEGYLMAVVTTAPGSLKKVTKSVLAAADQLAHTGATAEEFTDAVAPILARTHMQLRDNSYWLWHVAMKAQSNPEALAWPLTRTSEFEQITLPEINQLARETLPQVRAQTFAAIPPKR